MADAVGTNDLVIRQGQIFTWTGTLTDTDTGDLQTGVTLAEGRIKSSAEATTVLLDLDAYITVDEPTAIVSISVPRVIVDALSFNPRPAVWDLFITQNGIRLKRVKGSVLLNPAVTD